MKQSVLKRTKVAYAKIQKAYLNGEIAYPRVSHDYIPIEDMHFYEYPHKPLTQFDAYSAPLKEEEYALTKETVPLFLTHNAIATPATLVKNIEFIDRFIDDDLKVRDRYHNDVHEDLPVVIEKIGDAAHELLAKEVASGVAPAELLDRDTALFGDNYIELLHYLSKEGDIWRMVDMQLSPYAISLAPDTLSKERMREDEDEESKPTTKPSCFKVSVSPSRNYTNSDQAVAVSSLDEAILIDEIRQRTVRMNRLTEALNRIQEERISNTGVGIER